MHNVQGLSPLLRSDYRETLSTQVSIDPMKKKLALQLVMWNYGDALDAIGSNDLLDLMTPSNYSPPVEVVAANSRTYILMPCC